MQIELAVFDDASRLLLALVYSIARILAAFVMVPLFSKQAIPGLVRTALAISFGLLLVPEIYFKLGGNTPGILTIAATVLKECLIGGFIGYAVAALFWAIEAVGFLIDNQRGASISSTLNPLTGNDSSPLGLLFNQAFMVYFLLFGGFLAFLSMLYGSFQLWPVVGHFPRVVPEGTTLFAGLFESVIRLGLLLSAPALVAMLLAEIGLGLVSRFAPQLQVFFLAMPVKSALAFLILVVYVPTLFGYVQSDMQRHLSGLLETLRGALR